MCEKVFDENQVPSLLLYTILVGKFGVITSAAFIMYGYVISFPDAAYTCNKR